jgi:hypothetical protein
MVWCLLFVLQLLDYRVNKKIGNVLTLKLFAKTTTMMTIIIISIVITAITITGVAFFLIVSVEIRRNIPKSQK